MKSNMSKQNVDNEQIVDYWKSFFPESEDNFEKIVTTLLGMDINKILVLRKEEDISVKKKINLQYFGEEYKNIEDLRRMNDKIQKQQQWVYFFEPIVSIYFEDYIKLVLNRSIIKDKKEFLEKTFFNLYARLINMSFRTIVMEINIASEEGKLLGKTSEDKGQYYCKVLLRDIDYLKEIYVIYPELIRLLDNCVKNTLEYLSEILNNIDELLFGKCEKYGMLLEVKIGLGDTHNNGRSIAKITFENKILYYKPRLMQIEKRYTELLKWCENKIPNFQKIKSCKVHEVKNAGFMEKIDNLECTTLEEISRFYYKIGELLCILYTLNSKDFHCENIIAEGDSPVLIDLETLLHCSIKNKKSVNIIYSVDENIQESVIGTSLLPTLLPNKNTDDAIEVGGIGKGIKQTSPFKTQVLRNVKSDNIEIEFINKELPFSQNYPKYKGEVIGCSKYLQEIREGFKCIYLWIAENKEMYAKEINSLFGNIECRVICKNTNIYTQLLETGYHPDVLHNKWDRLVYLCRLGLLLIQNEEWNCISLYKSEYNELINGDIPIFYTKTSDYAVYNRYEKRVLSIIEKISVMDVINRKVKNMGNYDYQRQIALINHSFMGSNIKTDMPQGTNINWSISIKKSNVTPLKMKYACRIADLSGKRGVKDIINGKQEIMWLGMRGFGKCFYRITPVGFGLYQGNSGMAIFYCLLYSKTKKPIYKKIASGIISSILTHIDVSANKWDIIEGYGAFTGITAELYTIIYLNKHNLIDLDKREISKFIEKGLYNLKAVEEIEEGVDVLSGLAGILGVYITAYEMVENDLRVEILRFLQSIVNKILSKAIRINDSCITWHENGDIGYAHGNAGIIAQLARYYLISNDREVKKIIEDALRYERIIQYDINKKKWHLRKNVHYFSWCNGIGGLLLEKIILLKCGWKDKKIENELMNLVEQLEKVGFGTDSSICHGDMGTIQLLKLASYYINSSDLYKQCESMEINFIESFLEVKWESIKYMENWGLMTGLAGIGVALIAEKEELTDILCLM